MRIFPGNSCFSVAMLAGALVVTTSVKLHAQQPPAWKQGMPASMADSKLAPHASPLTVVASQVLVGSRAAP